MDQTTSDLVLFFGRFHPLILHLPIGFLLIAFLLEILSRFKRFASYQPAVGFILFLGAISAIVAAVLGLMLAQGGGYGEELLSLHQWLGIGAALTAVVALILHWQARKQASLKLDKAYISVLSVMIVVLMAAGHYGGSLTHGSDYLTQYMPNPLRTLAGLEPREEKKAVLITNLPEAQLYHDIIYPILDARCVSCHNPEKRKGELEMHTVEALLEGGENGALFEAGNPAESHMMKRILLPEEDEEHMPPDGKSQLTEEQVELLNWWIAEGAPFDKKVAQVNVSEDIQNVLNTLVDPNANKTEVEILLASEVQAAEEQTLSQLQTSGVQVMPLAAQVNWLQVRIPMTASGDSLVQTLSPVAGQLTWLDMGDTQTTDEALAAIPQFTKLTRLHLENTQVTDNGLQHLKDLPYLEYLNLYGTEVTDEGIQQLKDLKNLRKLYLWQTKATKEGVAQLQEALPQLEVNMGIENWGVVEADSSVALND
ncbi:c-type cytochrome domain-containing protein [Catalinimonas niigatensis]|uniref:c-type cytochrome domain-containing protein n=1 Tax=Catalinimonas niigatensis TaxID=1397264 RepID=UPI0026671569|nr:c-type cytochrome domain-containing protein [Catalinimonas niigatensis]WPP48457.1 c-type cytochrome domain-containing protein [Catalinimonas niigatensis]